MFSFRWCYRLLFDAKQLVVVGNHTVNAVRADALRRAGHDRHRQLWLLHGNEEPILLFHRITAAFVVAVLIRWSSVCCWRSEVLHQAGHHPPRRRNGGGLFLTTPAEGRAAAPNATSVTGGDSGAAREQTHDTGKGNESGE